MRGGFLTTKLTRKTIVHQNIYTHTRIDVQQVGRRIQNTGSQKMKELKNNSFSVLDFLFSKTRKTQIFLKGPMHIKCTVMHK